MTFKVRWSNPLDRLGTRGADEYRLNGRGSGPVRPGDQLTAVVGMNRR